MHALVLISISHHTKFEMHSINHSTDIIGSLKFKNGSRETEHAR